MTGFSRSPRLAKAGLVLIDPESGAIGRIIVLHNSETLSRSLDIQAAGEEGERSKALWIKESKRGQVNIFLKPCLTKLKG